MDSYDAIIIGAGPAGSTAARLLAQRGLKTVLIDKSRFPRHKTCASWINRLVFERFPYLQKYLGRLVDTPFYGVTFLNETLERQASFHEKRPSGYLTLRSKFDDGLKEIAVSAGCEFVEGVGLVSLNADASRRSESQGVTSVRLEDNRCLTTRVLVGADGAHSKVAHLAGFRRAWRKDQYVMCANEDIPYDPLLIERRYSKTFPLFVALRYGGIEGYGWLFPKCSHICVGIGGRLKDDREIRPLYQSFIDDLRRRGLIPSDLQSRKPDYAVDPAGAVTRAETVVKGKVLLIGDAAGFVSGSTGEGIYPAMVSAECAADVITKALTTTNPEDCLSVYNQRWKEVLGGYLRYLPGGMQRDATMKKLGYVFKSGLVCRVAARSFLYGEGTGWRDVLRNLW
jgi:geranylgeranyl reductase family protein